MATSEIHSKKRRYPRADFHSRAELFYGRQTETTETIQLSEGGMLVYSTLPLDVGDPVTIHLSIKDSILRARGEVLYIFPAGRDGRKRLGIGFKSLFEDYRVVIRELTN